VALPANVTALDAVLLATLLLKDDEASLDGVTEDSLLLDRLELKALDARLLTLELLSTLLVSLVLESIDELVGVGVSGGVLPTQAASVSGARKRPINLCMGISPWVTVNKHRSLWTGLCFLRVKTLSYGCSSYPRKLQISSIHQHLFLWLRIFTDAFFRCVIL